MGAGAHIRAGPEAPETLAAHRQLTDERGQTRIVGIFAGRQTQMPDRVEGAGLPVRVQAALGLLEKEVPGGVEARHRPAVEEPGQAVPRQDVEAVVHDQRGRVGDQVEHTQQLGTNPATRRLRAATALAGEPVQVLALGLVEAENASQRIEYLLGGLGRPALFQANVVVDADPGQVGDLLAAQPGDPAAAVGGDSGGRRVDPGTPGSQKAREIVHIPSITVARPTKVVLPIPGSPVRRSKRP